MEPRVGGLGYRPQCRYLSKIRKSWGAQSHGGRLTLSEATFRGSVTVLHGVKPHSVSIRLIASDGDQHMKLN